MSSSRKSGAYGSVLGLTSDEEASEARRSWQFCMIMLGMSDGKHIVYDENQCRSHRKGVSLKTAIVVVAPMESVNILWKRVSALSDAFICCGQSEQRL